MNGRLPLSERVYCYICSYLDGWGYTPEADEIAYDLGATRYQVDLALRALRHAGRIQSDSTMPVRRPLPPAA